MVDTVDLIASGTHCVGTAAGISAHLTGDCNMNDLPLRFKHQIQSAYLKHVIKEKTRDFVRLLWFSINIRRIISN